ncbi:hypothetical protein, partial [Roseibium sp. TrichSKD4]
MTKQPKWTQGPWVYREIPFNKDGLTGFTVNTGDAETEICEISPKPNPVAVNIENARLIAAAPELFGAAQLALQIAEHTIRSE